ncbi:uncharacterized protein LOC111874472 isoform X3 [Cryptotermes secundus]|uniref:uncharacterized protein LOC111874472 isoform X3 n=1 Tax=Cryptotermes secundus TaxID=105785 RepID=UPI000CD7B902|nr:uncharacterized protein LOC111874472 isoform X3 [Cryptotermes secundus]
MEFRKNMIIKKEEPNSDSETQISSFTEYEATDIKDEEISVTASSSGLKSEASFIVNMNTERPQTNVEDQQMFSLSENEAICVKQEEDPCTEILPDLDGEENLQEFMTIKQDLQNQLMVKHEVIVSKASVCMEGIISQQ